MERKSACSTSGVPAASAPYYRRKQEALLAVNIARDVGSTGPDIRATGTLHGYSAVYSMVTGTGITEAEDLTADTFIIVAVTNLYPDLWGWSKGVQHVAYTTEIAPF